MDLAKCAALAGVQSRCMVYMHALVVVQQHDDGISPVAAADDRHVCIAMHTVKQSFQRATGLGIRNNFHTRTHKGLPTRLM